MNKLIENALYFIMLLFVAAVMVLITAVSAVSFEVFDEVRAYSHRHHDGALK